MDTIITAPDGTRISTRATGDGSPLVLVHGTTGSKDSWGFVAPALEARHTVFAYDRRGRGGSDAGSEGYGLSAEIADLRAVIEACPAPPHLVAHSFGAVCALEAAIEGAPIASLAIYEPPVHLGRKRDVVAETQHDLAAGDANAALERFLPLAGSPLEEVRFLQSMPEVWEGFLHVATATLARELDALVDYEWDPARLAAIDVPALVMSGALSDSPVYATPDELLGAVPDAASHVFAGQRHIAMSTDPGAFADAVLNFTAEH